MNSKAFLKMTLLKDALGIARIPSILLGHLFSIVSEVLPAFWLSNLYFEGFVIASCLASQRLSDLIS